MANKPVHKQTTKPTPFESKHDAATMLLSCYVNEFWWNFVSSKLITIRR